MFFKTSFPPLIAKANSQAVAVSAFKYCDWIKALAANLQELGFCDEWKRSSSLITCYGLRERISVRYLFVRPERIDALNEHDAVVALLNQKMADKAR